MSHTAAATAAPRHARRGFTLIELLVVIAIIAILASILFPVFARARENARRSSCQSNLKQLGLSMMQYSQDYDEKMVPFEADPATSFDGTNANPPAPVLASAFNWTSVMQPYLKSVQIMKCPSDPTGATVAGQLVSSYTYNAYMGNDGGKAMAAIQSTALTPIVTDCFGGAGSTLFPFAYYFYPAKGVTPATVRSFGVVQSGYFVSTRVSNVPDVQRHLETANYLFADGHVKALKAAGGTNNGWGSTTFPPLVPPYNGYDYDGDGTVGTTTYQ
jgi:prepilin-type N-terminal cleavage/methylation domain-containing protein/prepilin-type processing-associated H-X9-DG protein